MKWIVHLFLNQSSQIFHLASKSDMEGSKCRLKETLKLGGKVVSFVMGRLFSPV